MTWPIVLYLGDLKHTATCLVTSLGVFSAKTQVSDGGVDLELKTPEGTNGEVRVPMTAGASHMSGKSRIADVEAL